MTPDHVLTFWFTESTPRQWFSNDDEFDAKIRARFSDTYASAKNEALKHWRETPKGRLAEIIVLDQFPRNMFRGSPKAFETDALALTLAMEAVEKGADKKLSATERHFLYMPYMHSESKEAHQKAFWLFGALIFHGKWPAFQYELKHKYIIDRFGRYPHRNAILGRPSTPEETEFLKTHQGF